MSDPLLIPDVESIKKHEGVELGPSDWIEVSQKQIDLFAEATGDRQWIHVDPDRAREESPFKTTIAHGYLTLALTPALLPQLLVVQSFSQVVNYGIDKMRLREAVPVGSRLRLSAVIKNVRNMPNGAARVTLGLAFELEGARRPACVGDAIYVYFP